MPVKLTERSGKAAVSVLMIWDFVQSSQNLSCGEGGMILSSNNCWLMCLAYRNCGRWEEFREPAGY